MRLTKSLLRELDSDNNNLIVVKDSVVFRAPKHGKDLFLALSVNHAQSGLRYVQLCRLPLNVARGLANELSIHSELDSATGPSF